MEGRKTNSLKKSVAPGSNSRSLSTLRTKSDNTRAAPNSVVRASTAVRNSPSLVKGHSETKSAAKGLRYDSQGNLKEAIGEINNEELIDVADEAYNSYLTTHAIKILLQRSEHRIRGDIDKQITGLQKRINENLSALEETNLKMNKLHLLEEQSELLSHHKDAFQILSSEPALTQGKSFGELMIQIDKIKNQLPCKNVVIPETSASLAEFQNATSQLLDSLEGISSVYGSDQVPISHTSAKLEHIQTLKEKLRNSMLSVDCVSSKATTGILNEVVAKSSEGEF